MALVSSHKSLFSTLPFFLYKVSVFVYVLMPFRSVFVFILLGHCWIQLGFVQFLVFFFVLMGLCLYDWIMRIGMKRRDFLNWFFDSSLGFCLVYFILFIIGHEFVLFCLYCCFGIRWRCGNFGLIIWECIIFKSLDLNVISVIFLCWTTKLYTKWKFRFKSNFFGDKDEELNLEKMYIYYFSVLLLNMLE